MDDLDTIDASLNAAEYQSFHDAEVLSLGVIWHRDHSYIGASTPLQFDRSNVAALSRLTPNFSKLENSSTAPLLDQHVSRAPLLIEKLSPDEFAVTPPASSMRISVNGRPIHEKTFAKLSELGEEIVITLANSTILCLFKASVQRTLPGDTDYGLRGVSKEITLLRQTIRRIAKTRSSVLIRGETGTGKELVAKAIHLESDRAKKPMMSVNMATLSSSLATADLFGVKRGAFTGATADKKGLFEQADSGVLFMDEIGDTPRDVQPMLLRTLESGEIRRVGDNKVRMVDVRVIAATDRSLESQKDEPSFSQPLLRRLENFTIHLPPLRQRRVDIGLLAKTFFSAHENDGTPQELDDISSSTISQLVFHDWPGNVRELRNVIYQMQYGQPLQLRERSLTPLDSEPSTQTPMNKSQYRHPSLISDDELIGALDSVEWVIKDAAAKLNVSRTTLYSMMSKSEQIRDVDDIPDDEITKVIDLHPDDLSFWAKTLRVGREALRKKIQKHPTLFKASTLR